MRDDMNRAPGANPAWVLQLTNADLIDALGTALEARETRNDAPDLMRRLDILSEEISRRESSGMLTENDWIDPAADL
jgi:hypothetical protein